MALLVKREWEVKLYRLILSLPNCQLVTHISFKLEGYRCDVVTTLFIGLKAQGLFFTQDIRGGVCLLNKWSNGVTHAT